MILEINSSDPFKYIELYHSRFWTDINCQHPKLGQKITFRDIKNRIWTPFNNDALDSFYDFLDIDNIPEKEDYFIISGFKCVYPFSIVKIMNDFDYECENIYVKNKLIDILRTKNICKEKNIQYNKKHFDNMHNYKWWYDPL